MTLLSRSSLVMRDVVICDSFAALFVVDRLVVVVVLGIAGNDVPGVKKSRQISETAKGYVDERVGGTDTGFDPDWKWDILASVIYCARRSESCRGETWRA
jgi:hypothetical protein